MVQRPHQYSPHEQQPQARPRRWALVTGASSGIGLAFAEVLAIHGYNLVLTARRLDRLEAIAVRIRRETSGMVCVLPIDLGEPGAASALVAACSGIAECPHIDVLVNNAGYALPGSFADASLQDHDRWLNVMVNVPVQLTRLLLPGMLERRSGRIINVASVAAFVPDPTGSLYNASKAFMVGETRAIARDVRGSGVTITAVCPGFTESEFHDLAGTRGFVTKLPSMFWMESREVAQIGWRAAERGSVVCVTGLVNTIVVVLARLIPNVLIDWLAPKQFLDAIRLGPQATKQRPPRQ